VVPAALDEGLSDPQPGVAGRVMEAMMQMDKLDVALLKAAREG
jgi:predicted 3-demethylubiquinone-9 3-methyltransferase (glyoxalase superfamily)